MESTTRTKDQSIKQFRGCYLETIRPFRITEKEPIWYQKHVEAFLDDTINTEKSYLGRVSRFLCFHQNLHPHQISEPVVTSFLKYLGIKRKLACVPVVFLLLTTTLAVEIPIANPL